MDKYHNYKVEQTHKIVDVYMQDHFIYIKFNSV